MTASFFRSSHAVIFITLSLFCANIARGLDGFVLTGENWTYSVPGKPTISGILIKPEGKGPFPAVILSHGKGGTASVFGARQGRSMASWGMVCIAPRYTHAIDDPDFKDTRQQGARAENLRRAEACLQILKTLPYVDATRIGAFGHSMGAYVTIALCGAEPKQIKAAAITSGGIIPAKGFAEPNVALANPIRTPMLIMHGTSDTVVLPAGSLLLKKTLDAHGVVNQRVLFEGMGHDLPGLKRAEVQTHIREWFQKYGVLSSTSAQTGNLSKTLSAALWGGQLGESGPESPAILSAEQPAGTWFRPGSEPFLWP